MPNINRTDDVSQQQEIITISAITGFSGSVAVPTGSTIYAGVVIPRPMQIQSAQMTAFGVSGAPQALLTCLRFGASFGTFTIGTTGLIPAYGTSGFMAYSLGAAGSTTLNLQKGDILALQQLGGSTAASTSTIFEVVVKNLQDVKTWY